MRPFAALEAFGHPVRHAAAPEGSRPTALPMGGLVRKWHLTPWKRSNLLDVALSDDGTDATGTSWTDVVNNLITQAGTVFTSRNLPAGSVVTVPRPQPGQVVPKPASSTGFLGLTTNQLLIGGAVVLGGLWFLKRSKR